METVTDIFYMLPNKYLSVEVIKKCWISEYTLSGLIRHDAKSYKCFLFLNFLGFTSRQFLKLSYFRVCFLKSIPCGPSMVDYPETSAAGFLQVSKFFISLIFFFKIRKTAAEVSDRFLTGFWRFPDNPSLTDHTVVWLNENRANWDCILWFIWHYLNLFM